MANIACIDQGTTSTRAYVMNNKTEGNIVYSKNHRQFYPNVSWVEHDPLELLKHIKDAICALENIDFLALTNQGESCLAWDSQTGIPISNVIVWQDKRTAGMAEDFKIAGGEELTLAKAGLPLDPYFSATKFKWILDNIPQAKKLLSQGRLHLGTTDAFFIEKLTGNFYTDITTASRTSLLNLETGQWDEDLCHLFSIPLEALPKIKTSHSDFGNVKLRQGYVPLAVSIVDQQAALYGHGAKKYGDTKVTFGTGAFALVVAGNKIISADGLISTVAWQQKKSKPVYALDGGIYCAGAALNWAKSLNLFSSFEDINTFDGKPAILRDLVFVPALVGLGSPHWDNSASGMWLGMGLETTAKNLVQAIIEGIAFRTAELLETISQNIGSIHSVSIDGGMAVNPYFCQFLSDVLQKEIKVPKITELTAHGACMMALNDLNIESNVDENMAYYLPKQDFKEEQVRFAKALERTKSWKNI